MDLAILLSYDDLKDRCSRWCQEHQIEPGDDWLPFYFAYAEVFYGLQFTRFETSWRVFETVIDLFEHFFSISLVLWLYSNGQINDYRQTCYDWYGIPLDYRTEDLPLRYENRCSDPLTRVVTFRPLSLPLNSYSDDDCFDLLQEYGFNYPSRQGIVYIESWKNRCLHYEIPVPTIRRDDNPDRYFLNYLLYILNLPDESYTVSSRSHTLSKEEYQEWRVWIASQLVRVVCAMDDVFGYLGGTYKYNRRCHAHELPQKQRGLRTLFTMVPPLPASIVVSRGFNSHDHPELVLNQVRTFTSITSTSMIGLDLGDLDINTYMILKLPTGLRVVTLFVVYDYQQEVLLSAGTKYLLNRVEIEDGVKRYYGEVVLDF